MERNLNSIIEGIALSDDLMTEVIFLYNAGVDIQDLKYFLALKLNKII